MVPEHPEVAGLRDRLVRWLRDSVRVGQPLGAGRAEHLLQLRRRETQELQVHVHAAQFGELDGQQFHVPRGQVRDLVVGDAIGPDLRRGEVGRHVDGHGLQSQLLRRLPARMADDDDPFGVHDDGLPEPVLPDGPGDGLDSAVVVAGVVLVGLDVRYLAKFDLHGSILLTRRPGGRPKSSKGSAPFAPGSARLRPFRRGGGFLDPTDRTRLGATWRTGPR